MIVFFGNTLNKHQSNVSDALYSFTGGDYVYVETVPPSTESVLSSKARVVRPYVLKAFESNDAYNRAKLLACKAEIVLFGADSLSFEILRMNQDSPGLSFEVSERWLKRGWINVLSPHLLKNMWHYHMGRWKNKPLYKLCSSAYGAQDQYRLHSFRNRCYKWGYFTRVDEIGEESLLNRSSSKTTILWCARFLRLKHPELVIQLAKKLKDENFDVQIDMLGDGVELEHTKALCRQLDVQDIVSFRGAVSNDEVLLAMRQHHIFLFTSDKNEGWGAVLNEAMSNGCVVVAADAIGSVPFLVKDGENGMIFQSQVLDSLFEKTKFLISHKTIREHMAICAYKTMRDYWSPTQAARNLLQLCDDLVNGRDSSILDGVCSKAYPFI